MNQDVRQRFDAAATTYRETASVQQQLAELLAGQLAQFVPHPVRRVLDAGSGTGLLTARLSCLFPEASLTALDLSLGMIEQGRQRLDPSILWRHEDLLHHRPPQPYDLVAGSSSLHWIESPEAAATRLHELLAPQGWLGQVIMVAGTLGELHHSRTRCLPGLSARRPMADESTWRDALIGQGLILRHEQLIVRTLYLPSASDVLRMLHRQGVTSGTLSRASRALTRGELKRLCETYEAEYREERGVPVTYRAWLVLAQR